MTKGVQDRMIAVERVRDDFHAALYAHRDVDAALALMAPGCVLGNIPSGGGAMSGPALRRYLGEVVAHLPADLTFRRVSRTGDRWRVAQEDVVGFTHDRELPWLLPGIAPSHRLVEVLAISVVAVERSLITSHRTLWNHTSLLAQLEPSPVPLD